jgi:putative acetyltransferase
MLDELQIRESRPDDSVAIESLYPEAFPDEDLLPLVRDLLNDTVVATSLVGTIDARIVGHVVFTRCGVVGNNVNASGLRWLEDSDVNLVLVLGDPAYYGRLGFLPESAVEPPFPLPPEWDGAWQSQYLGQPTTPCAGKLSVPPQWLQPALWAP